MRKILLAMVSAVALNGPALADVILDPHLSGTGDNVIFDSLIGNLAIGSFNGMHQGLVNFTDLSNNPLFTGAQNGNDIKISNTNDMQVQVFDTSGLTVLNTLTDVFSLKGTGSVTAFVSAVDPNGIPEALKTFSLGPIDPNAQSGFTFSAINGESISKYVLFDTGGTITDFEHYRIDVAPAAVPGPVVGAGSPGILAAALGFLAWRRRRRT
jgi:hypothetical protein